LVRINSHFDGSSSLQEETFDVTWAVAVFTVSCVGYSSTKQRKELVNERKRNVHDATLKMQKTPDIERILIV